jgi:hypothetical protein
MKSLGIAIGVAVLAPSLAWGHSGGLDAYGCHNDNTKGDYHCHEGKLKGRTYQSQNTMLTAHPALHEKAAGERAKKEEAEDKLKQGDKTRTEAYAKEGERKTSTPR